MAFPSDGELSLTATSARHGLLRQQVYTHLRDAILAGRYEPGTRLRVADLATELDVSRTPVREALRTLEDEGWVETWANRWTRVAPVDLGEAGRVYPIVWALERLALTEVDSFATERIDELDEANQRLRAGLEGRDAVVASMADRAFHDVLVCAWDNPELVRILGEMKLRLRRIELHYFGGTLAVERSIFEHQAVIDALRGGNLAAAAAAVEQNWRNSLARLQERTREPAA